jgi:glycosyltransferase involved in cell wall biosynthesis
VNKISISFVASTFTVGGSERVLSDLITRLPASRFDKKLYFLRDAGKLGRELLETGIAVEENLQKHRLDPGAVSRLVRGFRRDRPDILFLLDHHNVLLLARLAGILARVPCQLVACHSTGKFGGKKNFEGTDRWLMEFTDFVIALSRTHARYLIEREAIDPGKITIIENGIDVGAFAPPKTESLSPLREELGLRASDRVVMMVAALRPEKAHECLLEAARLLVVSRDSLKFLIVGDGPRRAELEALSDSLGLGGRVSFLGVRKDVAQLLQVADVLVLPSYPVVETLPMAVLEAMAAEVPVVATGVGSLPEMIESGRTGLLIDPGDPAALARAIEEIISDPDRAREIAREARATVEKKYSVKTMVERYIALFESLVAS